MRNLKSIMSSDITFHCYINLDIRDNAIKAIDTVKTLDWRHQATVQKESVSQDCLSFYLSPQSNSALQWIGVLSLLLSFCSKQMVFE